MYTIIAVCIIIVLVVLLLSVLTTSKAYSFKHTIDPLKNNPNLEKDKKETKDYE